MNFHVEIERISPVLMTDVALAPIRGTGRREESDFWVISNPSPIFLLPRNKISRHQAIE